MKILITALLLLLTSAAAEAQSKWTAAAAKLRESIVNVESSMGRCTGFVIDNEKDLVLTAAHCDGPELYADLTPAKIKAKDVKNDLLVLHVEGIDRPALKLAKKNPIIGEEVASYGYGWGLERPMFRVAHISDDNSFVTSIEGGPWFVFDAGFVGGQSGGPVVNIDGEVVSVVQRSGDGTGLGMGVEVIAEKVGKYFGQ
jgi:S1-C subfamily serine protease